MNIYTGITPFDQFVNSFPPGNREIRFYQPGASYIGSFIASLLTDLSTGNTAVRVEPIFELSDHSKKSQTFIIRGNSVIAVGSNFFNSFTYDQLESKYGLGYSSSKHYFPTSSDFTKHISGIPVVNLSTFDFSQWTGNTICVQS